MSLQGMFSVVQNIIVILVSVCNALRNTLRKILDISNFSAICTTFTKIPKRSERLLKMFIIKLLDRLLLAGKTIFLRVFQINNEQMYLRNMSRNFARNVSFITNCLGKLRAVNLKPEDIFKKYLMNQNISRIFTPVRQNFMLYYFGVRASQDDDDSFDDSKSNSSKNDLEDTVSHFEVAEKKISENENINSEIPLENLVSEPRSGSLAKRKPSCELIHELKRIRCSNSEVFDDEENATTDTCIEEKYFKEKSSSLNIYEEIVWVPPTHKTIGSISIIPSLKKLSINDSGENRNTERSSNMKEYQPKFYEFNPDRKCLRLIPDIEVWKKIANELSKLDQLMEWIKCHPGLNKKQTLNSSDSESSWVTDEDVEISCDKERPLERYSSSQKAKNTISESELEIKCSSENETVQITAAENITNELNSESFLMELLSGKFSQKLQGIKDESHEHVLSPNSGPQIRKSVSIIPSSRNVLKNASDENERKSNMINFILPKLDESNPKNIERCLRIVPDIDVWKNIAKETTKLDQLIERIKSSKELKELSEKQASNWSSDSESSSNTDEDEQIFSTEANGTESKELWEELEERLRVAFNSSPVKITWPKVTSPTSKMDRGCLTKMKEYKILSKEQRKNVSKNSFEVDLNLSDVSAGNSSFSNEKNDVNESSINSQSSSTSNELPSEYQDVPPLVTNSTQEFESNEYLFVNSEKPHLSFDSPASKEKYPHFKKIDDKNLDAERGTDKIAPKINKIDQNLAVNKLSQGYAQNNATVLSESARNNEENISFRSLELASTIGIEDFEIGESSKPEEPVRSPEPRFRDPDYKPYPGIVQDTTKVKKDARYQKKFYQKPT